MSKHLNRAQLIGHLGKDPEVRRNQAGTRIASFSVATTESWKDKTTGAPREYTQWHQISIKNDGLSGIAEQYLRKGSKIFIEGQLETRTWKDDAGRDCYMTEIVLRPGRGQMLMLDGFRNAQGEEQTPTAEDLSAMLDDSIQY